jgi:uncharacterized membrane protein YfcA
MSVLLFTSLAFVTALFAGLLGALTGLGGGVVNFPVLVVPFKVDLRYALGASLVSITRVVFCVADFARQKDRLYVLISSTALVILICSLFQGGR